MQLSIREHPWAPYAAEVRVNGRRLPHWVAAHEGEGWAGAYRTDDAGRIALVGGEPVIDQRIGLVEIGPIPPFTRAILEQLTRSLEKSYGR